MGESESESESESLSSNSNSRFARFFATRQNTNFEETKTTNFNVFAVHSSDLFTTSTSTHTLFTTGMILISARLQKERIKKIEDLTMK